MMITEAIVLAGGLGTRLRSKVHQLPKCMAPVAGIPFIDYVIGNLEKGGIQRFVFAVGYLSEPLVKHILSKWSDKIECIFSKEEEPLGTGGAVLQASKYIKNEDFIVCNGDTLFDIDIVELYQFHLNKNAFISVALKHMQNFERYGTVTLNENENIIAFHEKKHMVDGLINAGIYILHLEKWTNMNLPFKFSFETEILEKEVTRRSLYGKIFHDYFIDIGIPEDFLKAQTELLKFKDI